jgi:hypothetical protein
MDKVVDIRTEVISGTPSEKVWQFMRLSPRVRPRYRFTASMVKDSAEATMTGAVEAVNYADAEQQINAMIKAFGVDDWHIDSIEQG